MKALLIEDEHLTAERLTQLLHRYDSEIEVLAIISSVENAIKWFNNNERPNIIFMDIHLSDGNAFQILEQVKLQATPIIFTTAYDEYAIKAFAVNSIDYLLKPIEYKQLAKALDKYKLLEEQPKKLASNFYQKLHSQLSPKTRFLSKVGENFNYIDISDIAYFIYDDGMVWIITNQNNKYPLDLTLDKIELDLNRKEFYRINRKFIVHIKSIVKIKSYTNSRLKLTLEPQPEVDVIVSRERVSNFKSWLDS